MTTTSVDAPPEPSAAAASSSSSSPTDAAATSPVHTYHCICTQLLLATTTPLSSLPRRANGSDDSALLDRAYILPLPARPPSTTTASSSDANTQTSTAAAAAAGGGGSGHYAILLNVQLDRRPRIVRREDGLEKRWVQRCARCACVVGYQLDWAHFAGGGGGGGGDGGEKEGEEGEGAGAGAGQGSSSQTGRTGWRRDVVYLLPEAMVGTEEMAREGGQQQQQGGGGGGLEKGGGGK